MNMNTLTLDILKNEMEAFKNTLVINDLFEVVRLVDVIEDDFDFYWVYDTGKSITYSSCLGGWIGLKGCIDDDNYNRMVRIWNLNHVEKAV